MNQEFLNGIRTPRPGYRVLVAVSNERDLKALLATAYAMAASHDGEIRLLTVTRRGNAPSWLVIPDIYGDVEITPVTRAGRNTGGIILAEARAYRPDALILGWSGGFGRGRYLLGRTLDPVVQTATCDVIVQQGEISQDLQRILVPAAGGPNAPRALTLARTLAPNAEVVALYVANEKLGRAEVLVGQARLDLMLQRLPSSDRDHIRPRVVQSPTPAQGILQEAQQGYDLVILGAGNEGLIDRFIFGDIPQSILVEAQLPVMVVRRRLTSLRSSWRRIWGRIFGLAPPLTIEEQAEVQRNVRRGSQPSPDFFITLTLAGVLAALGLMMDSAAVIIGAMIVAPLMVAILGMGLAIVLGDPRLFWRAAATTLRGMGLALAMGFVVGLIVPGAQPTNAVMALTKPSLMDLAVALAAGVAAAYATSRKQVSAALAGVAVAASLTPPLVTIGLGLAFQDWEIAWGSGLIFLANLVAIVATSGFVFLWMGFRPQPGDPTRSTIRRRGFVTFSILLILITIPLAALTEESLRRLQFESTLETAIREEVNRLPGEVIRWEYTVAADNTLNLDVTVRVVETVTYQAARDLQQEIAQRLDRTVALSLGMVPTKQLRAYVPPTPTFTPTLTPTGLPSATPTSTPTATSTPTNTPTPIPTSTPVPTITPMPSATPTPTPWVLTVVDVGNNGLRVRYAPEGTVMGRLAEGESVVVLEAPVEVEGNAWYHVRSLSSHIEGWVTGEFLGPGSP
ncbi:MAG: TIGR00341 family protein [Anaerolineae bacterium]